MEKMVWEKPELNEVAFAANEYVAACGDSGKVYKFVCDAPGGELYYYKDLVVSYDENGVSNRPKDTDWSNYNATNLSSGFLSSYFPCKETHEAESTNMFYWGFVDRGFLKNGNHDASETVIVWRGPENNNGHATANLDMNSWETAKS